VENINEVNKKSENNIESTTNDLSSIVKELLETNQKLEKEIAERKKVEQALRLSEQEIRNALNKEKELNDLKSRFVSMASHEFRTPLSTIQSSAELIQKYQEAGKLEKTTKHFGRIDTSIKNLINILNDFLSISKLEEGELLLAPEQFSLHTFFADLNEKVKSLLKKGQYVEMELPEEDAEITLDKKALFLVLENLFSNAIKYSEENQKILLYAEIYGEQLIIKVQDQGMGIPHNEQRYLFERFFRGSNVINIKGTGLGLNIIKQYIDMMNGSIYFESEQGMGTTFTIVLPLGND